NGVFPDPALTLAAVDRLVHHATIFEMKVESYRRRSALQENAKEDDRLPSRQSKTHPSLSRSGNQKTMKTLPATINMVTSL
ncbi:MAG: hypothetical protein E5W30_03830, partial [Mesorhizobium sp.]